MARDNSRYNSIGRFFNAMVSDYKFKIEKSLPTSDIIIITYHDPDYVQALELFPKEEKLHMVDDIVVLGYAIV